MSATIKIQPKNQQLFFVAEFSNTNAAYKWEYRDGNTANINSNGDGHSENIHPTLFEDDDTLCNKQDLAFEVAAGNTVDSDIEITIYQGPDDAHLTKVGFYSEPITSIPFKCIIHFVTA